MDRVDRGQLTGFHVYPVDCAVSVEKLLDVPRTCVVFEIAAEHLQGPECRNGKNCGLKSDP